MRLVPKYGSSASDPQSKKIGRDQELVQDDLEKKRRV